MLFFKRLRLLSAELNTYSWTFKFVIPDLIDICSVCNVLQCEWEESHSTIYWGFCAGVKTYDHIRLVIHMLRNLMTQWREDVKEQRIFSPDKIFTASKESRRNLWSIVALAKSLVDVENRRQYREMASRWDISRSVMWKPKISGLFRLHGDVFFLKHSLSCWFFSVKITLWSDLYFPMQKK